MILIIVRGLFILMTAVVAGLYAIRTFDESSSALLISIASALAISAIVITADVLTPHKKLSSISGVYLGLLVGLIAAYPLSYLVQYVGQVLLVAGYDQAIVDSLTEGANVVVGIICIFVAISLILQTKDDFRFIIPYVEFDKKIRGTRPMLLDTSAVIDGRILDIADTQIMQGLMVVPRFVLNEMQTIADSHDPLKRARGRRGLDIVAKLQANTNVDVNIDDASAEGATVDQQLVTRALDLHARIITTDFNLTKIAKVRGIDVININSLAEALRPVVLPGELMSVKIVKPGESNNQGVGYLEDGTMVVVEHARQLLGHDAALSVTSVLQTSAGRMIFGKLADESAAKQAGDAPAEGSDKKGAKESRPKQEQR
ncbi:MAG: PIN/TRAM domain-containing protein [Planctomycetota bacterium]|jgi:uncharacterized protein YacL